MPGPSSRPEAPLGPGGGVGIVVDEDGLRDALPQSVAQRLVAPGQVRGEDHSRAVGGDEAGSTDTDGEHLVRVERRHQLLDDADDDVLDHSR